MQSRAAIFAKGARCIGDGGSDALLTRFDKVRANAPVTWTDHIDDFALVR